MVHINKIFGKYKKNFNMVVYFHIFSFFELGCLYPLFKGGIGKWEWVGLYIDYIARLTSFKLPLSFLLGRLKKRG